MELWKIMVIAVGLGGDAFSVALGIGSKPRFSGQAFRLGFHFGLFQTVMPLIGWGIGWTMLSWVQAWDHWIASIMVGGVAVHALVEAFRGEEKEHITDYSRGWYLVSLSVATSIDALAVGFAFGVLNIAPWRPSVIIGITAGLMTLGGLFLGRWLRSCFGKAIQVMGGILLLFIAFKLSQI
ncbi:MAG: manganese efflux pump MntP family protein [bacterium]